MVKEFSEKRCEENIVQLVGMYISYVKLAFVNQCGIFFRFLP